MKIEEFERVLPGYRWLIRSNPDEVVRGVDSLVELPALYFANVMTPDFRPTRTRYEGQSFKAYADTPERAFDLAARRAMDHKGYSS